MQGAAIRLEPVDHRLGGLAPQPHGLDAGGKIGEHLPFARLGLGKLGAGGGKLQLQLQARETQQRLAGRDLAAARRIKLVHPAGDRRIHIGRARRAHDAGRTEMIRHGSEGEKPEHERRRSSGDGPGTAPGAFDTGFTPEVTQTFDPRHDKGADKGQDGREQAEAEILVGHKQDDRNRDEDAVNITGYTENRQAHALAGGARRAFELVDLKGVAFPKVHHLAAGAGLQIGALHQVGEDVIAVEAQQRIQVEQQGRNRGDDHGVVGETV